MSQIASGTDRRSASVIRLGRFNSSRSNAGCWPIARGPGISGRGVISGTIAGDSPAAGESPAMVPEITPRPEMPGPRAIGQQPALLRLELNLPNLITLARLLSVPLAIWLILDERSR